MKAYKLAMERKAKLSDDPWPPKKNKVKKEPSPETDDATLAPDRRSSNETSLVDSTADTIAVRDEPGPVQVIDLTLSDSDDE
ncbi:hypothetical protein QCA50_021201 [Cerrena zonata]|uniref:Uncharacterized protein n=1 Tax=Cerrena zonata TaxID=2478898 RepID=A0AAW0FA91_9APHY